MISYRTVYRGGSDEIVEKKSRFIAQVFPVETQEEAMQIIEQTKKKYWDARHNCYAFILGSTGDITRCSDDGEPSGTAGRPILEVLLGQKLRNTLVVVTRYFGGTLLGTGGLVRAYSRAAQAGIDASSLITKQPGIRLTVDIAYDGIGRLQHTVAQLEVPVLDTVYSDKVQMLLLAPEEQCNMIVREIAEITAGQAAVTQDDILVYYARLDGKIILF